MTSESEAGTGTSDFGEEPIEDVDESTETIPYRYSITSYGADFLVESLVAQLGRGDIVVPGYESQEAAELGIEGFQRKFIWTKPQCHKFVESLLLGLPVPGVFFVKEGDGRMLVLDGQQRLRTLYAFYKGVLRGREFRLEKVQKEFAGRTYEELDAEDRRRLDNSIIHATIVRQDEPSDDMGSIYLVFERLNTGGTALQPEEIRVALYNGPFVRLLSSLNDHDSWRLLYGHKSKRLKDQEQILRFLALRFAREHYQRPMKEFLNTFIGKNRNLQGLTEATIRPVFEETADAVLELIGANAFRLGRTVNAAVLDSVMVGISERLARGKIEDGEIAKRAYDSLIADTDYIEAVSRATADEENVRTRIEKAIEAFSKVT